MLSVLLQAVNTTSTADTASSNSLGDRFANVAYVTDGILQWQYLVLLACSIIFLNLAKVFYCIPFFIAQYRKGKLSGSKVNRFNIDRELVEADNKAIALSFAGYLVGIGLILRGSLSNTRNDVAYQLFDCLLYTGIGFIQLFIAQLVNDKLVMTGIENSVAVFEGNVAVAVLEAGSFIASGNIIGGSLTTSGGSYGEDIFSSFIWFFLGQFCLVVFCKVYEFITPYDDNALIRKGNVAAGLGYSLTIVSIGLILANPITKSDSLAAFFVTWFIGSLIAVLSRVFVSRIIIRRRKLDDEIAEDANWGASLVEGLFVIGFAIVFWGFLKVDKSGTACITNTGA